MAKSAETMGWAYDLIGRRAFLIGGVGAGLAIPMLAPSAARAAPGGVPANGQVAFKVYRKGSHIGEHDLRFEQDGDLLTVTGNVRILVRVGPVPVYRYSHRCTERWRGDRFVSMDSATQSNVSKHVVSASRAVDGVRVTPSGAAPYVLPGNAAPLTHWNKSIYGNALFNPDDGKILRINLAGRAEDNCRQDDGSSVRATRYTLTGDSNMDDYYDAADVWAGLHTKVEDGSFVDYRRV